VRKQESEITGIGAAIAAGLHVGQWSSLAEVESKIGIEKEFEPSMSDDDRKKKLDRWS
jgi:glycerol kinase